MSNHTGHGTPRPKPELHGGSSRTYHRHAAHLADDIDDIAVEQLIAGAHPQGYTSWERREAVRRLHATGMPQLHIARRIGIAPRQVTRDLERYGLVATGSKPWTRTSVDHRRATVARLLTAGARVTEVAVLLHVTSERISEDRALLGLPAGPRSPIRGRSRAELLAAYGHLLDSNRQEASA